VSVGDRDRMECVDRLGTPFCLRAAPARPTHRQFPSSRPRLLRVSPSMTLLQMVSLSKFAAAKCRFRLERVQLQVQLQFLEFDPWNRCRTPETPDSKLASIVARETQLDPPFRVKSCHDLGARRLNCGQQEVAQTEKDSRAEISTSNMM